ncbi:MAG: ATP-binding cassette domain-containing protein [Clostridia bacterium]|nr:ATP-binding cassette domain-containing protein [Clostridia bacterium]
MKKDRICFNSYKCNSDTPGYAVCLSALLAYYGKDVSPIEIDTICGVDGDMAAKFSAAESFGISIKGVLVNYADLLDEDVPFIAENEGKPVIVTYLSDKYVYVFKPSLGDIRMSSSAFQKSFSGMIYRVSSDLLTVSLQKRGIFNDFDKDIRRIGRFVVPALLFSLLVIFTFALIRVLPDYILNYNGTKWNAYPLLAIINIILLLAAVLSYYLFDMAQYKTAFTDAERSLPKHILGVPKSISIDTYWLIRGNTIADPCGFHAFSYGVFFAIFVLLSVVYLTVFSPLLSLVSVTLLLAEIAFAIAIFGYTRKLAAAEIARKSNYRKCLFDYTENRRIIELNGFSDREAQKLTAARAAYSEAKAVFAKVTAGVKGVCITLTGIAVILLLSSGLYFYILGSNVSVGKLTVFILFVTLCALPSVKLYEFVCNVYTERTERGFFKEIELLNEEGGEDEMEFFGLIELHNVTLKIKNRTVFDNFNFTMESGSRTAVYGESGSGKSTLARLITGQLDYQGEILCDGVNIKRLSADCLAHNIYIVNSESMLFVDSIRNNITFFNEKLSNEEVIQSARIAELHDSIIKRDDGYESKVEYKGLNMSKSERVKIELARAIANDCKILIIDEATECLDVLTEKKILDRIGEMGVTVLLFTTREGSLTDCDAVYNIKNRKLI